MYYKIVLFIFLCLAWVVFSGLLEPYFLVAGLICVILSMLCLHKMQLLQCEVCASYYTPRMITYILWLVREVAKSTWDVTKVIWKPKLPINPVLSTTPMKQHTYLDAALYGNSITLTPGTISVSVDHNTILVHALDEESIESLEKGKMNEKILSLSDKDLPIYFRKYRKKVIR